MRVKSRKPPAEYLMTSLARDLLEVGGCPDDVVGDEMGQVGRHREDEIVVPLVHHLHHRAERPPEVG